ncbi:MAG: threonine synthase [Candidatus Aminicenantes bacterium]|nr:threonine synthase [Candidatus Aminicenantes bacterium]
MEKWSCLNCEMIYEPDIYFPFCRQCNSPLIVWSKKKGRRFDLSRPSCLEKFKSFLPLSRINKNLLLGEGNTPLIRLFRLEKKLEAPFPIYAKNEMANPTHSFKDRGTAVVIQKAVAGQIKKIGTVSTGNMAASTAAYGAKAGLKTFILLKEDASFEKTLSTGVYGAHLISVKGDYGGLFKQSYEIGKKIGIYFANSCDPYRLEGYKLTSFEIYFQLGQKAPEYLFVPVSSGGHLVGLLLGFLELKREGYIRQLPHFIGLQARGCSPIVEAWEKNLTDIIPVKNPQTLAHAISNPSPPAGRLVLKLLYQYGGQMIGVTDEEIMRAQAELASFEGLFCDPASATTLAGLKKWRRLNPEVKPREAVLVITGSGLKDLSPVKERGKISLIPVRLPCLEEALVSLAL